MDTKKDLGRIIKKEVISAAIERFQRFKIEGAAELPARSDGECEVEFIYDNAFMNRSGVPLAMDIVRPVTDEKTELPVVVVLHGGGLVLGDRRMARRQAVAVARRGYLVFTLEYRLAPMANVCDQLDDVCAGLDYVGRRLVEFNVDFTRIYMMAESAGAFLAVYVTAMKKSEKLQAAIGYEPSRMTFKAIGLNSGMFYTDRKDPLGLLMKEQFYGEKVIDPEFVPYMDPENPEIIKNLPPCYFVTSRGDFLNNYTLMYHRAVSAAGIPTKLRYFGSDQLQHAFAAIDPYKKESQQAIGGMLAWFEEQARKKAHAHTEKEPAAVEDITQLKAWKYIREMNSDSEEKLKAKALTDGRKEYTYEQMFRIWDRYAAAFSALDITGKGHARAAMVSQPSLEPIFAFYALNMVGASVSMIHIMDLANRERFLRMLQLEGVTDVILADNCTTEPTLRWLLENKDRAGLRHVIVLHTPVGGITVTDKMEKLSRLNAAMLRTVPGALHMTDLIRDRKQTPIAYAADDCDEAAVIIHTSGTTKGIHKPIPLSDTALNRAVHKFMDFDRLQPFRGHGVMNMMFDQSAAYGMVDQMHLPLAMGLTMAVPPMGFYNPGYFKAMELLHVDLFYTGAAAERLIMRAAKMQKLDYSAIKMVLMGGFYTSVDQKKRWKEMMRGFGADPEILIGYGLSEVAGVCIMTPEEREDDVIGYPLPGTEILIRDEEDQKYYHIEDGPRIGDMFISSDTMSMGKIDDRQFFDTEEIGGKTYLNTYDMIRVNEDLSLTYAGRLNRFFVNNEGIRFDAGLIECALHAEENISACAIVPEYNKMIHDTLPILYVKTALAGPEAEQAVKEALRHVFVAQGAAKETNLPSKCVITDDIPYNANGKVDIYQIIKEDVKGREYVVVGIRADGELRDIILDPVRPGNMGQQFAGFPEELRQSAFREDTKSLV